MPEPFPTSECPYPELMAFFSSLRPSSRVLDLGCGRGRNALHLARLGHQVVAADNDAAAIASLADQASKEALSIQTLVADMDKLPLLPCFDFILLDRVLHYLDGPERQEAFLAKVSTLLAPQGILCAVFVSESDESFQVFSSFVGRSSERWQSLLNTTVTHNVAGAGNFTFHAQAWRMDNIHHQTEASERPPYLHNAGVSS